MHGAGSRCGEEPARLGGIVDAVDVAAGIGGLAVGVVVSPLLDRLVALLRPGGLLVTDNVLWEGQVVPGYRQDATQDPEMKDLIASYNRRLAAEPRLRTSTVPLRDGVAISVKVA